MVASCSQCQGSLVVDAEVYMYRKCLAYSLDFPNNPLTKSTKLSSIITSMLQELCVSTVGLLGTVTSSLTCFNM